MGLPAENPPQEIPGMSMQTRSTKLTKANMLTQDQKFQLFLAVVTCGPAWIDTIIRIKRSCRRRVQQRLDPRPHVRGGHHDGGDYGATEQHADDQDGAKVNTGHSHLE